jgi:hypothetical protein
MGYARVWNVFENSQPDGVTLFGREPFERRCDRGSHFIEAS